MHRVRSSRRGTRGFSLLEVLIAVVVLSVGLLALAALQGRLTQASAEAKVRGRVAAMLAARMDVLRNGGYGALRSFVAQLGVGDAPGLDLPGLDAVAVAQGYGMSAELVTSGDRLAEVLACTATSAGPRLLEVPITAETRPLG